jgi:hypothetical protein
VNFQSLEDKPDAIQRMTDAQHLEADLVSLLGYRDAETVRLAQAVLERTTALSGKYEIARFAIVHNLLVNLGIKERGLCCHWTEDLLQTLNDLKLEKFRIVWAVSNYGSLREHSGVAVVPVTRKFEDGLVLDPWRNAGKLYWSKIAQDSYDWRPHPGYIGNGSVACEDSSKS